MTVFEDRVEAGRRLAEALREGDAVPDGHRVVVLAIPRGGLPVAAEVARELDADLDVVVVRKLRSPHNPELGFGAVGLDGSVHVDEEAVALLGLSDSEIEAEVADRRSAVRKRAALFREVMPAADLDGAVAVVVDDGIATGGTAREACMYARRAGADKVILAVPVAPSAVAKDLRQIADEVLVLSEPAEFMAVAQGYRDFSELDDEVVMDVLRAARGES